LPSNHPKIATDYNNLATIYYDIGQYRRALEFFNKALDIHKENNVAPNHPFILDTKNNIDICSLNLLMTIFLLILFDYKIEV